jgi:Ca-activated chloride channel homolog
MVRSRLFYPLIVILVAAGVVWPQEDDPVRVETAVVRVNVGVVDQRGRPITSLDRSNFSIYEDGVKQEISRFETTTAPFSVVMLLDMSGSTKSFRQNIKLSAARFLDALGPEDRIAVVEFYSKIRMLNDFTTNRRRAAHSISVANGAGETDLYKAIDFAIGRLSQESNGRKAIVVLTDGVDTESQRFDRALLSRLPDDQVESAIDPAVNPTLNRVLDQADRHGITIYPLALPTGDPARLADPTPRQVALFRAARDRLQLIADRSGGTMNTIRRLEEMGLLYAQVAADLRTLYTVEYQPFNLRRDGKWRSINVQLTDPELIARSRNGYFAR